MTDQAMENTSSSEGHEPITIMVTGSRAWQPTRDQYLIVAIIVLARGSIAPPEHPTRLIHGGAPGVDTHARHAAEMLAWDIQEFPPDKKTIDLYGFTKAAKDRNQAMVDERPHIVCAFPGPHSKGTYDAIRRAMAANIHVVERKVTA